MAGSAEQTSLVDAPQQIEQAVIANLGRWPVPQNARVALINIAENWTYSVSGLIGGTPHRSVLRVHRPGYHTMLAIRSELAWQDAIRGAAQACTPPVIPGVDGDPIQLVNVHGFDEPMRMVLFTFVDGDHPNEGHDLVAPFETLGRLAASLHEFTEWWQQPTPFERLSWDTRAVFGDDANWGDWRLAPNVSPAVRDVLERVETRVSERLLAYGRGRDRFGLIHADMRLANLLIDGSTVWLIDFDDCGFGWYLYDFAAAISFMEDHPQVPALKQSWLTGYRKVRALTNSDEAELDTFIMFRRLALLAWIGTHMHATEPRALAPDFARISAELGEAYLAM